MTWERSRGVVSFVGTLAGLLIALRGIAWHSVTVDSPATVIAGMSLAATWFLIGSLPRTGIAASALSGVAAIALTLAATGRWTIPFLLFWLCSNTALVLGSNRRWFSWMSGLVLLVDLPVLAGLILSAVRDDVWMLPAQPDGAIVAAVSVAAALRIALVAFARDRGPEAPLLAGSGFVLLALLGPGAAVVPAALLIAGAALLAFRPVTTDPVAFVSLLALGCALIHEPSLSPAGIATVLIITGTLSSAAPGRTGIALLAGPWPGTALFVAVTGAAIHSAGRIAEMGLLGGGAYLAASILLPLATVGAVHLAAPLIRGRVQLPWGRPELCAAVGIVAGLSAAGFSAPDPSGYLYMSAIAAAGLFVIGVPAGMLPSPAGEPPTILVPSVSPGGLAGPKTLRRAALAGLAAAWLSVSWATIEGMRDGFL